MALLLGNTRLPRYPSRYIQLLLELVTKFTLHVGRISFVCKNKKTKWNQLPRAPRNVGRRNSMRGDKGTEQLHHGENTRKLEDGVS